MTAAERDKSILYIKHHVFALCSYKSIVGDTSLSDTIILKKRCCWSVLAAEMAQVHIVFTQVHILVARKTLMEVEVLIQLL